MHTNQLLQTYDRQMRQEEAFPGARREDTGTVIRTVIPDERFGYIAYATLNETTADAEIEAQQAYFRGLGLAFEWKVYDHDQPPDLRQRLAARGFEIEDPEALLVMDLDTAPEIYWTMNIEHVIPVTDPYGLEEIIRLEEEVWNEDHSWMRTRLGSDLLSYPDRLSIFAVAAEGRVVSAAWVYYHPPTQFASLWGGSTLAAYRGRGYYTALVAARARQARQRGLRFLSIDASPMSRPILEKHGFQFLGYSTPCKWKPPKPPEETHG